MLKRIIRSTKTKALPLRLKNTEINNDKQINKCPHMLKIVIKTDKLVFSKNSMPDKYPNTKNEPAESQ
jgi:hypothetical protein